MIEHFVFFVLSLSIGYVMGYFAQKERIRGATRRIERSIQDRLSPIGRVKKLSPDQIEKKHNILGETERAMKETFDELL